MFICYDTVDIGFPRPASLVIAMSYSIDRQLLLYLHIPNHIGFGCWYALHHSVYWTTDATTGVKNVNLPFILECQDAKARTPFLTRIMFHCSSVSLLSIALHFSHRVLFCHFCLLLCFFFSSSFFLPGRELMAERWITKLSTGIQVTLLLNKYLLSLITSTQWIILRVHGVGLQKTKNITILFLKGICPVPMEGRLLLVFFWRPMIKE